MGVRYLRKAETGTAVSAEPTIDELLALATAGDPDAKTLDLVSMLAGLQSQGNPGAGLLSTIMNEQSQRAMAQASSYAPGTKYLQTMNPGGVFDAIGSFMTKLGFVPPRLESGQRLVNYAPLDSMGSGFDDALGLANQAAAAPALQYDNVIQQLLAPLIARATGNGAGSSNAPAVQPIVQGDLSYLNRPSGIPEGVAYFADESPPVANDTLDIIMKKIKGSAPQNQPENTPGWSFGPNAYDRTFNSGR